MSTGEIHSAGVIVRGVPDPERRYALSEYIPNEEIDARDLATSPAYRAEAERTSLANAISLIVLRYRTERGLSQTALGKILGMPQPQVSRIESGDVNPSMDTLITLSEKLGLELAIDIRPAGATAKLVSKAAHAAPFPMSSALDTKRVSVLVAARAAE